MAFEDGLGIDPSQPAAQDYTVNATGLVSRTLNLWIRNLAKYIVIVGLVGAVLALISFILVMTFLSGLGVLGTDPVSFIFGLFSYTTFPPLSMIVIPLGFAVIAFVINAIVAGAAIKYTLDDYAGARADIGLSFSHAFGKALKIMIVQIIVSVIVTASITPSLVLMGLAMEGIDISDPFNPIIDPNAMVLMMQAMVFLIVGGIIALYISVRFAPTTAIVVDTDLSAIDSLKKSWDLTSGNFLHVFAGLILLGMLVIVLGAIVGFATLIAYPFDIVISAIVTALLFGAFNYIFAVVLYRDLDSRTGSTSLEELMI
ncbi:MAG: hypothetical protein ACXAEF_15335 [Candidatus Thorarchaeota archaeon]